MTTLLETLNQTREQTIDNHLRAAVTELTEKVSASPFCTEFSLTTGCPSKQIGEEVAKRLTADGIKAVYAESLRSRYLTVTVDLPENLAPKVEQPVQVEAETKVETVEQPVEQTN